MLIIFFNRSQHILPRFRPRVGKAVRSLRCPKSALTLVALPWVLSNPIYSSHNLDTKVLGYAIYVIAGKTTAGPTRTLFRYDALTNKWTQGADLPSAYAAIENPAVVAVGNTLYSIGGITSFPKYSLGLELKIPV